MAVESDRPWQATEFKETLRRAIKRIARFAERTVFQYRFTSLTGRIVFLNVIGLCLMVGGILYLNQSRAGLIKAKVKSLEAQGQIIAAAIAASATVEPGGIIVDPEKLLEQSSGVGIPTREDEFASLEFPINPEQIAPILRHLVDPTGTRGRIYNSDGTLAHDTDQLYSRGEFLGLGRPPIKEEKLGFFDNLVRRLKAWYRHRDLPVYKEIGDANGKAYSEVESALTGILTPIVRANEKGELVIGVAVPIKRFRRVLGVFLLSTRGGDIDASLSEEHGAILKVSLFVAGVTGLLSFVLAGTIAGPMHRLSAAAENVRKSIKAREEIPDLTHRSDEIGHLSGALREMTAALYRRIDAIESFAADVAHELKNPLTSLRSAAETFPLAKTKDSQEHLIEIIQNDVGRLDRLITDISVASRLDAELAREDPTPVDIVTLVNTMANVLNDVHRSDVPKIHVEFAHTPYGAAGYLVSGYDTRLGQVLNNLVDNAISFSPPDGRVFVKSRRVGREIEITIEDEGPGILPDNLERIFERFYTDRPGEESFGKNSGLGLNISRQIVTVHKGRIWAENRYSDVGKSDGKVDGDEFGNVIGARFVIRLPALVHNRK